MAGDWIPMRLDLSDDPSVIAIAAKCDLDEHSVIGRLYKLWSWANRHLADGNARGVTESWVDRYLGVSGFASAMIESGWLGSNGTNIVFPNFERWNSKGAKTRILTANRVKNLRSNAASVTPSVTKTLPENSRVENTNTICPPSGELTKTGHDTHADGSPWVSSAVPIPWESTDPNYRLAHDWLATRVGKNKYVTNGQARSAFEKIHHAHLSSVQIGEVLIKAREDKSATVTTYLPPTPHSLLVKAIAESTGTSETLVGGEIGALASQLLSESPPYFAADVRELFSRAEELVPFAFQNGRREISINEIRKHIPKIRSSKSAKNEPQRGPVAEPSPEQREALAAADKTLNQFMARRKAGVQ